MNVLYLKLNRKDLRRISGLLLTELFYNND